MRTVPVLLLLTGFAQFATAGDLIVYVTDRDGQPVSDVAVYLTPQHEPATPRVVTDAPHSAVMEQIDGAFVPHLLVVETGTEISFPNNDSISHHVYSFSEAKAFQLDLYRGNVHPPQLFDEPGLVVLGCNIHDSMLAFILVVDTPWSAITTQEGIARFADLPDDQFEVSVWTSRAKTRHIPPPQQVSVIPEKNELVSIQFESRLSPPLNGTAGSLNWENY